jgi:hypothetical protein
MAADQVWVSTSLGWSTRCALRRSRGWRTTSAGRCGKENERIYEVKGLVGLENPEVRDRTVLRTWWRGWSG